MNYHENYHDFIMPTPTRSSVFDVRQHRTINGCRLCRTLSLHIFRHLAQILLDRRKPACTQFIQSDEKSD